jgi:ActR/RegA family two-component response regulator
MEHKGRVLIVEDTTHWQDIFSETLTAQGYDVKLAGNYAEAKEIIFRRSFELAIVDIRLSEGDVSNQDGMQVLREIRNTKEPTSIIIVSGYATVGLTVEAFEDFGVFKFLEKDRFEEDKFLELVKIGVQKAQASGYGNISLYQMLLRNPFPNVSTFLPVSHDHEDLLQTMFEELWPLAKNPQFVTALVETWEGKHLVQIIGWSKGIGEAIVVRFGPSNVIKKESQNFPKFVNEMSDNNRSIVKIKPRYKSGLGGLVYILKGAQLEHLRDFTSFYTQESAVSIIQTLQDIFGRVCVDLYRSKGIEELKVDLSLAYKPLIDKLSTYREKQHQDEENYFRLMDEDELESYLQTRNQRWPVNPIDFVLSQRFVFNSPVGIVHGDLRDGNIIVDSKAQVWLLGHYDTGVTDVLLTEADGPNSVAFRAYQIGKRNLLHDFAALEVSIRATLNKLDAETRRVFDLALCQPRGFGEGFSSEAVTFSLELEKAYSVIASLRGLLFEIVDFQGDMQLYYTELLLQFLNTYLRSPDELEKKEQMWMSAATLAERLEQW